MATFNINLAQVYYDTFGLTGLRRFPGAAVKEQQQSGFSFDGIKEIDSKGVRPTSILGTPILMPFEVMGDNYEVRENGRLIQRSFEDYLFPNATVVDFNRMKRIVKTEVQGREGTVKEMIGMDDWTVTIRGIITNDKKEQAGYPEAGVERLRKLCEVPVTLPVRGRLFELLGIYNIVIEKLSLPSADGYENLQPFSLDCISDEPIELQLKKGA